MCISYRAGVDTRMDWHAGLSIYTGYGNPAGRTGLARRTERCAASVRKPQTWGRRGQNFLFRTSPASLPRPTSPRIIDIAQIKITVVAHLDVEHIYKSLEVDY